MCDCELVWSEQSTNNRRHRLLPGKERGWEEGREGRQRDRTQVPVIKLPYSACLCFVWITCSWHVSCSRGWFACSAKLATVLSLALHRLLRLIRLLPALRMTLLDAASLGLVLVFVSLEVLLILDLLLSLVLGTLGLAPSTLKAGMAPRSVPVGNTHRHNAYSLTKVAAR